MQLQSANPSQREEVKNLRTIQNQTNLLGSLKLYEEAKLPGGDQQMKLCKPFPALGIF